MSAIRSDKSRPDVDLIRCDRCKGTGKVRSVFNARVGDPYEMTCGTCAGLGEVSRAARERAARERREAEFQRHMLGRQEARERGQF